MIINQTLLFGVHFSEASAPPMYEPPPAYSAQGYTPSTYNPNPNGQPYTAQSNQAGSAAAAHYSDKPYPTTTPNQHQYPVSSMYPRMQTNYPVSYPPQTNGYPPQTNGYPPQTNGYPPQTNGYPPQTNGYPPQMNGYPSQPNVYPAPVAYTPNMHVVPMVSQTYVIPNAFDSGARFDSMCPPVIPPPPPGCAPNTAQMAFNNGNNVVLSKKRSNWFTGGKGGGTSFW
jgi:hypothetical protein